jgi:hypothetical protein
MNLAITEIYETCERPLVGPWGSTAHSIMETMKTPHLNYEVLQITGL